MMAPVFRAGSSVLHGLDPLPKLAWLLAITVAAVATPHWKAQAALLVVAIGLVRCGGVIRLSDIKGLMIVWVTLAGTLAVVKLWLPHQGSGGVEVNEVLAVALRMGALILATVAFVSTTDPSDIGDMLCERLHAPAWLGMLFFMTLQSARLFEKEYSELDEAARLRRHWQRVGRWQGARLRSRALLARGLRRTFFMSATLASRGQMDTVRIGAAAPRLTRVEQALLAAAPMALGAWVLAWL